MKTARSRLRWQNVGRVALAALAFSTALGCATLSTHSAPLSGAAPPPPEGGRPLHKEVHMQSNDDLRDVLQLVIDLPQLGKYYHEGEAPGRKPLVVLKNAQVASEPALTKFGEPVRYASREEADNRPYLEFTKVSVEGDEARVEFTYPVEGISGVVTLRKASGAWAVESSRLVES